MFFKELANGAPCFGIRGGVIFDEFREESFRLRSDLCLIQGWARRRGLKSSSKNFTGRLAIGRSAVSSRAICPFQAESLSMTMLLS